MEVVYIGKGEKDVAYKIGRTSRPAEERQRQHQTSCPTFSFHRIFQTQVARGLEKKLHEFFSSKRNRGTREWFHLNHEDIFTACLIAEAYEHELLPRTSELADLTKAKSSDSFISMSTLLEADYIRLRELRQTKARIEHELELIEAGLKVQIGCHAGIESYITWKSQEQRRFDGTRFRQAFPDLYEEFRAPSIVRYFELL